MTVSRIFSILRILPFALVLLGLLLHFFTYEGGFSKEGFSSSSNSERDIKTEEAIERAFQVELEARSRRIQSVCKKFRAVKVFIGNEHSSVRERQLRDDILPYVNWKRALNTAIPRDPSDSRLWALTLHVVTKFKWVYCHVAKVGSRNILRFLVNLSNPSLSSTEIEELELHTRDRYMFNNVAPLISIAQNSTKEALKIMKTYKKFVFVRNPLDRLLSAWNDKLYSRNSFYAKHVGRRIIKFFRGNASIEDIRKGYPVYLGEFLRSLLYTKVKYMDHHWMPMHRAAMVCAVDYDFIGHIENMEFELSYLAKQMTGRQDLPNIPATEKTDVNRTNVHIDRYAELRKLPRRLVEVVLRKQYQLDYDMFGYSIEEDLDKVYGGL